MATMKRILLERPGEFTVAEAEVPAPGPGEALVCIRKVGVCGSDIHLYQKGRIGEIVMEGPFVIGHECMGVVEAVGEGADDALVGRRVAVEPAIPCGECRWCVAGMCNVCPTVMFLGLPPTPGAFQEYLVHPAHLVEPLGDGISDAAGVVLEPLAIALHAVHLAKVRPGQRIAILGTGVLGTCVLSVLGLYRGLRVVCSDLLPDRLERAEQMGAAATVRPGEESDARVAERIREALGGDGADVVFECAGAAQTLWSMCEVGAAAAHVAVIGSSHDDRVIFSSGTSRRKGLTLRFVRRSLHTLGPAVDLVESGALEPERLVTHTFGAGEIGEAFQTVDGYRDGVLKALVDMESW
jgi:L-iditol 2-dehydrogenase